jgi:lipoprotein-releasing system permease protein
MSPLPFELLLALRYLRPKRTFVSVITVISILGVMLGVAVLIIVISVMSGFDRQLRERILGFNAHLRITRSQAPMGDYEPVVNLVRANSGVRAVAPFVLGQVLIETQPATGSPLVAAPWVRGLDPAREHEVSVLPNSMVRGEFSVSGNGVLVGVELAHMLELNVGDLISIYSPRNLQRMRQSRQAGEDEAILPDEFVVRGIFDVGYYEYNASVVACSLGNAQDLYDLEDSVHGLLVMLEDPLKVQEARAQLQPLLGPAYSISTWTEQNSGILNALVVEKNVMFYILFFIVLVAAFGITSALITFVVQKTREIGVLKSLGATQGQVVLIFLSQSFVVGIVGVCAGLGLGWLAIGYRNEFLNLMNRLTGFELFPASIYSFTELPALIIPGDIAIICGGSLVICVLAGLVPAWIAGRLQPVEALRYE